MIDQTSMMIFARLFALGYLSGSVPYGSGGTITVMEMRGGVGITHPVWTGTARTLVAEVNADDITNIVFHVTSQSQ